MPIVVTASQTRDVIARARADRRKLEVFEQGLNGLGDKLEAWLAEGFALYAQVTKDPAKAAEHLRQYLESRLGHQLPPSSAPEGDVPMLPFGPGAKAHLAIVWWVAEASAGEGDQLMAHLPETPDELPTTDADLLAEIDPALTQWWTPPPWLWRPAGHPQIKAHSPQTAQRELAFIHWELWERLENAIRHAEGKASLAPVRARRTKKSSDQCKEDKHLQKRIRDAISAGHTGHGFCDYRTNSK
jgi:hypothetical protein